MTNKRGKKFWAGHKVTGKYVNEGLAGHGPHCLRLHIVTYRFQRLFYGRLSPFAEDGVENILR